MSYSRRQLYALGEPIGDSVTRLKLGGRIYGDGGGGGGGTPSQTTQTTDLPDWAKGYAKDALAKGQALTDTSQNPYQTYGGERIAGFSDLQKQAQQGATNMQTAGQVGLGSGLAGAAGLGALGTNYQGGNFYGGQFNSDAAKQYMNPYMQNVVDVQQREAQRQADIAGTQRNAQAVGAGAFGGSRQAITDAEAARNLALQKGDIQAQGLNQAYGQAANQFNQDYSRNLQAQQLGEQSRQYGAGLGMQGLQTGLQAAGQLGQLGQTQYGQEMGINQLQNQYGAQQQQQQQRGLDTAYQDFLNQQNYPYKQLGFMSDLIRGLPLGQKSTSTLYEGSGNLMGQLGGLGMGAYGLSKMGLFAEGGLAYAGGGVTDPQNVENILSKLSDAQLQQAKKAALDRRDINEAQMIDAEIAQRATMRQGIAPAISDQFANDMEQSMATGGIVAFADRGVVTEGDNYSHEGMRKPDSINMPKAKPKAGIPDAVKQAVPALSEKTGVPEEDLMARVPGLMDMFQKQYAPLIEQQRAMVEQSKPDTEAMKQQGLAQALTQFGFKMAANAARPGARFLESAAGAAPEISTAVQDMNKLMSVKQDNYNKLKMDQMKYENALQIGNMKDATLLAGQIRQAKQADKQIGMQQDQLAATIRHQTEMEAQGRRGLDIQSAQVAATTARQPETIKGLSEMLQNATPEQRKAIEDAARLRYGMSADIRADASLAARRATAVEKAQASMAGSLLAMTPRSDPKYAERKAAFDEQVQRELDQLPVDTRSGSAPATSAPSGGGTIMRFDSKVNPI
jgi:hypothetical protein